MRLFCVFAKFWQPGRVKTRLAGHFGDEAAASFHRISAQTLLRRFSAVGERRVLAFTPKHRRRAFAALADEQWQLMPQSLGDLGKRMSHFFSTSFANGAQAVVVIGADSPTLPQEFVDRAFERLRDTDAVLGPSDDGGYYLIGLSRHLPDAFKGIAWGTSAVLTQTLQRLSTASCRYALLPAWYDVDTPRDLDRLRDELANQTAPEYASLRRVVSEVTRKP